MSSSNRAHRRRQERARKKQPIIIAGDGIVAQELEGHRYEAKPSSELPKKVPGRHRWVATGSWVLGEDAVAGAMDPDLMKILDNENLMHLGIGCWDCEQPLGVIDADSRCPAPGWESQ